MRQPFAFGVAVEERAPSVFGEYDHEKQQFMWEGDSTVVLGSAVCTRWNIDAYYSRCTSTGTTCNYGPRCTAGLCGSHSYYCDYG
ncbi:hypothetical protein [Nonomuraea sp. B19D2]|uniref:hypothetical protein n=1 Tax=Nonomuraea sp. B19D2 TaxID=3159561 RepID=UPI0032DAE434